MSIIYLILYYIAIKLLQITCDETYYTPIAGSSHHLVSLSSHYSKLNSLVHSCFRAKITSRFPPFFSHNVYFIARRLEIKNGSLQNSKRHSMDNPDRRICVYLRAFVFKVKRERGESSGRSRGPDWREIRPTDKPGAGGRAVRKQTDCIAESFVMRPWYINYSPGPESPLPGAVSTLHLIACTSFFVPSISGAPATDETMPRRVQSTLTTTFSILSYLKSYDVPRRFLFWATLEWITLE